MIWEIADKMEQKDNLKAHKVLFHSDYGPFYYLKKTLKLQAKIGINIIGRYGICRCEDRIERQRQMNLALAKMVHLDLEQAYADATWRWRCWCIGDRLLGV
jgi:hypothetical protein